VLPQSIANCRPLDSVEKVLHVQVCNDHGLAHPAFAGHFGQVAQVCQGFCAAWNGDTPLMHLQKDTA
jgi:hypothetical protein